MDSTLHLDFSKNKIQQAFMECTARYQCYSGGFGSGKTTACCAKGIVLSVMMPGNCGLVTRNTYPDLRDSTRKVFFETLNKAAGLLPDADISSHPFVRQWKEAENRMIFKNGSEVLFRHFEEGKIKTGPNLGWFYIDQAEEAPEDVFNALIGRNRRNNVPRQYGMISMNPNGMDWQYRLFVEKKDPDFQNFDSTTFDNQGNLPKNYITDLLSRYSSDWVDRFVHGKWTTMSGLIFHEFDKNQNTCDPFEVPREWVKVRGLDWGIDAPATSVTIARSTEGIFYVVDEYGDREKTPPEHAKEILERGKSFPGIRSSILDASAFRRESDGKSVADQYRTSGIHCLPATKDILARIALVKNLLKTGRLVFVNGATDETQKELQAWKWGARRKGVEVPAHGNDHYLDALGYGVYWLYNRLLSGAIRPEEPVEERFVGRLGQGSDSVCDAVTGMPL